MGKTAKSSDDERPKRKAVKKRVARPRNSDKTNEKSAPAKSAPAKAPAEKSAPAATAEKRPAFGEGEMHIVALQKMSIPELHEIAKGGGIEDYVGLKKQDLIFKILSASIRTG